MPTYQYSCSKCGEDLEVYQSFSEPPLKRHQGCGGTLRKVFAPVGIVLKGSGFYKTDSRSGRGSKSPGKSDSGGETKTEAPAASSGNGSAKENGAKSGSDKSEKSAKPAKPAKQST